MCRTSEDPVKHVISFRVNKSEKEVLDAIAFRYGVSISTLVRNCVNYLDADLEKCDAARLRA